MNDIKKEECMENNTCCDKCRHFTAECNGYCPCHQSTPQWEREFEKEFPTKGIEDFDLLIRFKSFITTLRQKDREELVAELKEMPSRPLMVGRPEQPFEFIPKIDVINLIKSKT